MRTEFNVSGMTCSACSAHVERAVKGVAGVSEVNVNLLLNSMTVRHDADVWAIIEAVERAGYGASVKDRKKKDPAEPQENKNKDGKLKRLWVSIIILIVLMYFSMGSMWGILPSFLSGANNAVTLALIQLLLTLPILIINKEYFTRGFTRLFKGSPNMDSLIAVGSSAALVYGVYALFAMSWGLGNGDMALVHRYHMDLYFESSAMIVTLISLGKYLEARSKGKTGDAIKRLLEMAPNVATVERNGKEITVPVEQVVIGDIVIVRNGARAPVDGILLNDGTFDESALTGESLPVDKKAGDTVLSGSILSSGFVKLTASKVGQDTTIAQIVELVRQASSSKAPIAKLADKVAGIFVPCVLTIAAVTFVIWMLISGDLDFALSSAICVLVISCPCALGLATPTAIMVGTGKGAEMGVLFRSAESLERLHSVKCVLLDKTGTVTEGKPSVTALEPQGVSRDELLRLAASAEHKSEHPLGRAIVKYALEQGVAINETDSYCAIAGKGISATVEGKSIICGNASFMQENGISVSDEHSKNGATPLYFARDGVYIGCIALADKIKPDSALAVAHLKKMGIKTVLLTGDNQTVASAIARKAGIDTVIAQVLPQHKERVVAQYCQEGATAMVGDGVNDAPALARADVGIAIGAGTDIAIESADVVLIKNSLVGVSDAIKLSGAVMRNIKQNLFWAFFYNCLGIPLAAGVFFSALGWRLSPMIGAAAMSLSSVFVVSNALRLRFFKAKYKDNSSSDCDECKIDKIREEEKNMTRTVIIEGMMCHHCSSRVEKALKDMGWEARVELEKKTATVTCAATDDQIAKCITDAGYEVVKISK